MIDYSLRPQKEKQVLSHWLQRQYTQMRNESVTICPYAHSSDQEARVTPHNVTQRDLQPAGHVTDKIATDSLPARVYQARHVRTTWQEKLYR